MIPAEFKSRLFRFLVFAAVLTVAFSVVLYQWFRFCLAEDLFSYALIVPGVTAWLIWQQKEKLKFEFEPSPGVGLMFGLAGACVMAVSFGTGGSADAPTATAISLRIASYVLTLMGGLFGFLGGGFIRQILFPVLFLFFMVPFPPLVVGGFEVALQNASAVVSGWFFTTIELSHLQTGRVFQLPNITIEVARECSGIRSTIVLFMTGLIAAYLFLARNWQRAVFCALIIPLGVARNAFRIVTIGWLCTEYGPEMIHSPIHHRGGPVFFALSLVPLFALLWFFRRMNRPGAAGNPPPSDRSLDVNECATKTV